ncbi:ssDNA-binding protein [Candidatus Liberibacter sp.]|uniref:ssDNA-binding protein n=1 Tax=Candidatus Liberibacter sp. TaxID=34022 RepID=UPI0015F579D7|nr:ssDNA-binding protein [Candidatus Liberibacter sp.]MBA5724644.1 DUF2815 family protein [Candidatus Liberibacter sp.]
MSYVQFGIVARLSYPVLFDPKSFNNDPNKEKEYSCDLLIPKSDTATYQRIISARKQAVKETWASYNKPNFEELYNNLDMNLGTKRGFFCGDLKAQKNSAYEGVYTGHWYLRATNKQQPLLADRSGHPIGENNQDLFYAGCWVKALLSVGAYENSGKGLRNTLRGLQFFRDDNRWGGNSVATVNEFSNLDDPNESMNFNKVLVDDGLPWD